MPRALSQSQFSSWRGRMGAEQRGAALLVLLVLSGILAVMMVLNFIPRESADAERERTTQQALAQAKQALIAYAVSRMDLAATSEAARSVPGFLPCPKSAAPTTGFPEGWADGTCGAQNVSAVGWLPWYTLGLPALRDGYGECLWYAVSGRFKEGTTASKLLNSDTPGQLAVLASDGVTYLAPNTYDGRAAAVIIAPGPPLGPQDRTAHADSNVCRGKYGSPQSYLEGDNSIVASPANHTMNEVAGGTTILVDQRKLASGADVVNDRVVIVTRQEIFEAVVRRQEFATRMRRLAERLSTCIAGYYSLNRVLVPLASPANPDTGDTLKDRTLPFSGALTPGGGTPDFEDNLSYLDEAGRLTGRAPYLLVATPLASPARQSTAPQNWLDLCPDADPQKQAADSAWYSHWKDHFFLALSPKFEILSSQVTNTQCTEVSGPPPISGCLWVRRQDGSNVRKGIAGIVIFAGRPNSTQLRETDPQKGDVSNYLNGINADLFELPKGTYQGLGFREFVTANAESPLEPLPVSGASNFNDYWNRHWWYNISKAPSTASLNDLTYCIVVPAVGAAPEVGPC